MTMHTYTPSQCPFQVSTLYIFCFLRYSLDKIIKVNVTTIQSHTMTLHTYNCQPISLLIIDFLHLTVSEILPSKIFKIKEGQIKVIITLHTYNTCKPMSVPFIILQIMIRNSPYRLWGKKVIMFCISLSIIMFK